MKLTWFFAADQRQASVNNGPEIKVQSTESDITNNKGATEEDNPTSDTETKSEPGARLEEIKESQTSK